MLGMGVMQLEIPITKMDTKMGKKTVHGHNIHTIFLGERIMTTNEKTEFDALDKLHIIILYRDGYQPIRKGVKRTTKTQVVVEDSTGKEIVFDRKHGIHRDRLGLNEATAYVFVTGFLIPKRNQADRWNRSSSNRLYLNDDAVFEALEKRAEDRIKAKQEARAIEEKKQEERNNAAALRMSETKVAHGTLPIVYYKHHGDQSVYVLEIKTQEKYRERKGDWETAIVKTRPNPYNPDKENKIEYTITYANGKSCSFASCSSRRAKDINEALWEVVNHCYHYW